MTETQFTPEIDALIRAAWANIEKLERRGGFRDLIDLGWSGPIPAGSWLGGYARGRNFTQRLQAIGLHLDGSNTGAVIAGLTALSQVTREQPVGEDGIESNAIAAAVNEMLADTRERAEWPA